MNICFQPEWMSLITTVDYMFLFYTFVLLRSPLHIFIFLLFIIFIIKFIFHSALLIAINQMYEYMNHNM